MGSVELVCEIGETNCTEFSNTLKTRVPQGGTALNSKRFAQRIKPRPTNEETCQLIKYEWPVKPIKSKLL